MIAREMQLPDWVRIPDFRRQYNFDWKFPAHSPHIVSACAVDDESGEAIAFCAADLVPEMTLAMRQDLHPLMRLRALGLIHEYMKRELPLKGCHEAICHVPPELERGYGRHLQRIFGWRELWKGYKLEART